MTVPTPWAPRQAAYRATSIICAWTTALLLSACLQQQTATGNAEGPTLTGMQTSGVKKPVYTTNLKIERAEIEAYVDQVALVRERRSQTFSKWVAAKGEYIYYGLYGLNPEQATIFGTIVAEFAHRTKLPVRPYKKGAKINWLFSYLPDLGELERVPQLKRIYCRAPDTQGCPDPTSPFSISKSYSIATTVNGRPTLFNYRYAGKLDPTLSGNALAARFVQDITHVFIADTSILYPEEESVIGFKTAPVVAKGPVYSWRVPIMDLLYLHAMYDPSIESGVSREVAATQIVELIMFDLNFPRQIIPDSTYIVGGRPR